jgi:hypothetical protein
MVIYDARPSAFTQMSTMGEWENAHSAMGCVNAIDGSIGSAMTPSLDTGGRNAVIADGVVAIKGQLWRCDAPVNTPIPAASAQNRIDRLVIRLTRGATTSATVVQPVVITGTPSGSPVIPPITQTPTGIWDIPVCHWTSTSAGGLTTLIDERQLIHDTWHDMRPLTGGFFGTVSGNVPPQYRFSDDGEFVEVAGYVMTPASAGNYNNIAFYTMPYKYVPQVMNPRWFASNVGDGAATPLVVLTAASGALTFSLMPASLAQTVIGIFGRYPLDTAAGFIQT